MDDSNGKRPTVPWFLVLATALGWLGLIMYRSSNVPTEPPGFNARPPFEDLAGS